MRNKPNPYDVPTRDDQEERQYPGEQSLSSVRKSGHPLKTGYAHGRHVFLLTIQALTVLISLLGSSRIARFLTAKISMDIIVEVTALFGRNVGHMLSTFMALIAAEPRIIAVIIAIVFIVIDLILWICSRVSARHRSQKALP